MKYYLDNLEYNIDIVKKNNKNTYIRVKDNNTIQITTNYFVTNKKIEQILKQNENSIKKMLSKRQKQFNKEQFFFYLDKKYDIIIMDTEKVEVFDKYIYIKNQEQLDKWYKKEVIRIFSDRLKYNYQLFEENITYPKLKFRKMKTRWGVCNRKNNSITLNTDLIKYSVNEIDYVIVHELAHFIEFNHSKNFWLIVSKYFKDYKNARKKLKE